MKDDVLMITYALHLLNWVPYTSSRCHLQRGSPEVWVSLLGKLTRTPLIKHVDTFKGDIILNYNLKSVWIVTYIWVYQILEWGQMGGAWFHPFGIDWIVEIWKPGHWTGNSPTLVPRQTLCEEEMMFGGEIMRTPTRINDFYYKTVPVLDSEWSRVVLYLQ